MDRIGKTRATAAPADGLLAAQQRAAPGRSDSRDCNSGPGARARYEPLVGLLLPSQLLIAARSNRPRARARLVESFMPLITSVARAYRYVPGVDRAELVQEGVVGILRALERYDPQLGTPFWSYASWWVREAMQQLVSEVSRPVVLSDRALRKLARVRAARGAFARTHGHEPSVGELANETGLPVQQLQKLVAAERRPRALERTLDDSDGARVGDLVADPRAEDAYDELAIRLIAAEVPRLLAQLNDREREVIEARYGLDGRELSLRELGQAMGVSAERVRQIEQAALGTLRAACSGEPYESPRDSASDAERTPRARESALRPGSKMRSARIGLRGRRPERRAHRRGTLSSPIENAPAGAG